MKKSIIFSENQDFTEDKMYLKKTSLKRILNSEDFVLRVFVEENYSAKNFRMPVFTPIYSSSSS